MTHGDRSTSLSLYCVCISYQEILMPELYDLINTYKTDYLWLDGSYGPATYWKN